MMIHACSYSPGYGKESDVRLSVAYTERINREWVVLTVVKLANRPYLRSHQHGSRRLLPRLYQGPG